MSTEKTSQERTAELQKCIDSIPSATELREKISQLDIEKKLLMKLLRLAIAKERKPSE